MNFPSVYESENKFGVNREDIVTARLTDDGTPNGPFEMIGDYSVTPGLFWAEVPAGVIWYIKTTIVYIAGMGNVTANSYGPVPALINGMTLDFEDDGGSPITPPFPLLVKLNGNFQEVGWSIDIQDTGPGVNHVTFAYDFSEVTGTHVALSAGQRIVARPNDNMTVLSNHNAFAAGYALSIT